MSIVVSSKSFPDPTTLPLVSDTQYHEPYSSAAINRKFRGILGAGIYLGLNPAPGTGLTVVVSSGTDGGTCSFDIAQYYQLTVRQQSDVTLTLAAGKAVIIALQATYAIGQETYQVNSASTIQAAEFVILDSTATLASNQLEICKVTVPAGATQITTAMIDLSGRVMRSIGIELSSAIDSTSETVAANSLAVKNAIAFVQDAIATSVTTKALTVNGAATVSSTLGVTGALTAKSTLAVTGASTLTGAATLKSTLNVTGNTILSAALSVGSTLTLTGAAALSSTLTVAGAATMSTTLSVAGALTAKSTLAVTGAATFGSNVIAAGYGQFQNTGVALLIKPAVADGSYYLRGQKYDNTAHWYLGQAGTTSDVAAFANNITGTSVALGYTNVTITAPTLIASAAMSVTGALSVGTTLTVSSDAAVSGAVTAGGAVTTSGELVSTNPNGGNHARFNNGTYSVIHRVNGSSYFILLTDSGSPTGTYNSLRPMAIIRPCWTSTVS